MTQENEFRRFRINRFLGRGRMVAAARRRHREDPDLRHRGGDASAEATGRPVLVQDLPTGGQVTYRSIAQAAEAYGIGQATLIAWLGGQTPQPCLRDRQRKDTAHLARVRFSWGPERPSKGR